MTAKPYTSTGQIWTQYLHSCTCAYNSFVSQYLNGLNPFN